MDKKKKPQQQDRWEREEQVLLVVEYYRVKDSGEEETKSNSFLSEILRKRAAVLGKEIDIAYRNEWGIKRQRMNMEKCDPDNGYILQEVETKWMARLIKEYIESPERLKAEAYEIILKYF